MSEAMRWRAIFAWWRTAQPPPNSAPPATELRRSPSASDEIEPHQNLTSHLWGGRKLLSKFRVGGMRETTLTDGCRARTYAFARAPRALRAFFMFSRRVRTCPHSVRGAPGEGKLLGDDNRRNCLNRLDARNLGNVVPQHVLDAIAQRDGRRRTAGAASLKMQEHCARTTIEAFEDDVAAVRSDRRTYARFEQLFDL